MYSELLTERERTEIRDFREIFYIRQANPSPQSYMVHDPDFFPFIANDHIRYQYQQIAELGRGAFGSVIKCYDHKSQRVVAVKLVRETQQLARQIEFEREFLQLFLSTPTSFSHHITKVFDLFKFRSFAAFVFEVLSCDLYTYLKSIKFKGLEMPKLQSVIRQLADALDFLHSLGIVHCDIKPENILWTGPRRLSVKLIDFGCACRAGHTVFSYIQSRFYRAPEVVLGLGYGCPIDVWGLGCVICELVNGSPMFPAHNETELLAMVIAVLGLPPDQMITESRKRDAFFERDGSCKYIRGCRRQSPSRRSSSAATRASWRSSSIASDGTPRRG
jgi:dual specificity tyrosine-phosphorylation-regulated kinase 2/3/4